MGERRCPHAEVSFTLAAGVAPATGLLDDTIIVFSCDHGDMMGDHGLYYKIHPYDASIRTLTIIYDPASKRPGGTVLTDMVEAVDIPGTFLEAGSDEHLQDAMPTSLSRSFLKYARGEVDAHREWAYCEHGHFCGHGGRNDRLARDGEWKYVFYTKGNMLFNIKEDPFEEHNLIDDKGHTERIHAMQARIIRRMGEMMIPPQSLQTNIPIEFYKGALP